MLILDFDTEKTFTYHWCGKFQAPTPEWIHMTRRLPDYELIVVTEGTLYIGDETQEFEVKKGQYLLMQPCHSQHGYRSSDCSFYWLHFAYHKNANDPVLFDRMELNRVYHAGHLLIPQTGNLASPERIIILMKQLQDSDRRYHEISLNTFITSAVLAELSNQSYLYKEFGEDNRRKQIFNDICDYITLRIGENVDLEELSSYFGYNKKYLSTFFRKQSGITVKQFMLQAKMDHAKAELTDTNHSISQIAYHIGFTDVHNFSNAFRKITGMSPSLYRSSYSQRKLYHV